jgi:acyl carrier protein
MNSVSTSEALEMLAEVSGITGVNLEAEFGKLGLDSLMMIEWLSLLEEKLGSDLNIRDLDFQELNDLSINDVLNTLLERAVGI